ncbi:MULTISPECIES: helix-turn-helix domain-containing protein [Burkholderia]|uniref:helix-turn-helix domain-containing protein n=1 Tax=Burkholderia TaxID=32008 RepID=UPI00084226E0|nr:MULTISPECIES: helix-turn-helix domain-containing protein [unclassified Burkholderia]AOK29591.1 XRE family transcriptional regulator [Burkholderia sp. Bp7605]
MSEAQPSKSPETNAGEHPAAAGLASVAAVGERLAELRRAKGWSVDDVSARLKIAAPKLQALEAGDTSQFPGTTFALGVVRSYAKMLGVDPEPFAQALRREKGVPAVDLSLPASSGADLPRGRVSIHLGDSSRSRPWLWAIAAAVVALVAVMMWRTGGESTNWLARFKTGGADNGAAAVHDQQPESAASELPASAAVSGSVTQARGASGAAEQTATQTVPGSAALAPAQVAGPALVASVAGESPASAASSAQSTAAGPAAASVAAAAQPQPSASASASEAATVAPGQSVVTLKVAQDCWFSVRDKHGKELFSALVRAGETKQVAGDAPLKVTIGNKAGLESIAFDGKPVDPAKYSAARGNVARFALP